MKRIFSLLLFCTVLLQVQALDLKDITAGKYAAKGVTAVTSSADGEFYYQAANKNTQIVKYAYKTGEAVATIFDVKTARECTINSFQGFVMSPDEKRLLIYTDAEEIYRHSFKATYYYFDIRRNHTRPLTANKEKQSIPTFSHDGRMTAFVINNNIWLAKFDFESESQVTKDGEMGRIINGATDWVYEEEFGTTRIMDFSADNTLLAFAKFDESEVQEFSFQMYNNQLYPSLFSFKYPKAGEKNSKISINVFDIEAKTIRPIRIPDSKVEYVPRIEFFPTGDNLAIMTLNREQNLFNMYIANARSVTARQILKEESDYYVDSELLNQIQFFDNQFLYLSEKDGYTHVYLYENNGALKSQLTKGNFDVTKLLSVDPVAGTVFFESAEESPMQRAVYSVDIKKGTKAKLSKSQGWNSATFSKNGKYFINRYSNTTTPTLATVNDAKGKELRVLETNEALKTALSKQDVPKKEFITLRAADGQKLNAYIIKPANFSESRRYPLLMVQYSGPNSQQVQDRFGIDWTDYLANQGYIIACVDGRGTGARGEEFRKCTYLNLGELESDDQIAAAQQLGDLPYIDKNKIAIWGWSYGGYNVLMSMSRSTNVFKAGVAIAPITDWKYYDTVYSERFMRTPQQNTKGYNSSSPIKLANRLNGNLLLVHGSADDNVHWQNSVDYVDALIKADKHFDMFMFPDKNHSILGASNRNYLYSKIVKFLNSNM